MEVVPVWVPLVTPPVWPAPAPVKSMALAKLSLAGGPTRMTVAVATFVLGVGDESSVTRRWIVLAPSTMP